MTSYIAASPLRYGAETHQPRPTPSPDEHTQAQVDMRASAMWGKAAGKGCGTKSRKLPQQGNQNGFSPLNNDASVAVDQLKGVAALLASYRCRITTGVKFSNL